MAEDNAQAAPPKNMKKILGFAFMGINLLALGFGAFLTYKATLGVEFKSDTNEDAKRELASFEATLQGEPVLYTMPTFSTNLDGSPRRLIRADISLEMMDEEGYEEVINLGAESRDTIIRLLNDKTYTDVETVQGKLHLKSEIITQLNGFLKKGVVKNVYFSDFVVQ